MRSLSLALCALALPLVCRAQGHPQWLPTLVDGGAPDCPDHPGVRQIRSETAVYKGNSVFISRESRRDPRGCHYAARLQAERSGTTHKFALPDAGKQSFSVVDFSPDGSRLLLASNPSDERDSGHVEVTTMPLYSGATHWESTWDLFGWKNCDTTVEPQGFMPDGKVIVMARPSIVYGHGQPNCVSHETLYEVDLTSATSKVMPDSLRIKRYGVVTRGPEHTCKTDPDLVAECFVIRGRVRFYNGGPSPRIWKVGTNRMLEVVDEVLPGELDLRMNWNTDAFGNFDFCPFTRGKPGVMQLVCIESARNVTYKKRE